jgi:hypothetical protein
MSGRLFLRFDCTTPTCSWSAWVEVDGDPDGAAREVRVPGGRPTCPICACRSVPDWMSGPRMEAPA